MFVLGESRLSLKNLKSKIQTECFLCRLCVSRLTSARRAWRLPSSRSSSRSSWSSSPGRRACWSVWWEKHGRPLFTAEAFSRFMHWKQSYFYWICVIFKWLFTLFLNIRTRYIHSEVTEYSLGCCGTTAHVKMLYKSFQPDLWHLTRLKLHISWRKVSLDIFFSCSALGEFSHVVEIIIFCRSMCRQVLSSDRP